MTDAIDAAIVKVLDLTPKAEKALIATGPAGAQRVFDIYHGRIQVHLITQARGRELVDGWAAALHIAASIAPEAFLEQLPSRIGTIEIGILGSIDDPRATAILCEQARHEDFLHRVNAIQALAKHTSPAGREAIESALGDGDLAVRSAAIRVVAGTDPSRGIALCEALLEEPNLTPLLRQETQRALSYLRKGKRLPNDIW